MATYTPNLNLKKPATTDYVDIADINGNMDLIDDACNTLSTNMQKKAGWTSTTVTVPKNNGTASITYSSLGMRDGRVYFVTMMVPTNPGWRYAGVLFIRSTNTLIVDLATSSLLSVSASGTGLTLTNLNATYDANILFEAFGVV